MFANSDGKPKGSEKKVSDIRNLQKKPLKARSLKEKTRPLIFRMTSFTETRKKRIYLTPYICNELTFDGLQIIFEEKIL